jgi:methyltransferase (TIGR00027 family)
VKDGEASTTARRVAAQRLSFARVVTAYGRPDADRQLQADVAGDLEGVETPMTRFLRSRTNFFDRVVVDSIDTGTDQVVLLGAGYDGRSLRYAKPGVRWFELDHRDTQADKRSRLHRLDIVSAAISFAAVDFGVDDVAAALRRAGYDPARPALFACEGVAGYLAGEVLSSLLDSLRTCAASGSTLAIDIPLRPESSSEQSRRSLLQSAVAQVGEPLVFAVPRNDLTGFLLTSGWKVEQATDPAGLELETSPRSTAFVTAVPVD